MFETLFGLEIPLAARFFVAFLVVLGLIGITAWLVRRFGATRFGGSGTRGRQPRLAVVNSAIVDGRRRLVLIRRDNIEHLLMLGGPTDVVVEPNIIRAAIAREPGRVAMASDIPARNALGIDNGWPLQPLNNEPVPRAQRGYRTNTTDALGLADEPNTQLNPPDMLGNVAAELPSQRTPDFSAPPRGEPVPRSSVASQVSSTANNQANAGPRDHNLTDMALRLETSLRRKPTFDGRSSVTDPAATYHGRPPEPTMRAPAREFTPSPEPMGEAQGEPRFEAKIDSRSESKFEPGVGVKSGAERDVNANARPPFGVETAASPGKQYYDNLEEEMATLLGRPSTKA